MKTRQLILEQAGHTVALASDDRSVEKACRDGQFAIVVIGQNISPAVKRRFFRIIRKHCTAAKILELHRPFSDRALEQADAWLPMPSDLPDTLANVVTELVRK